MKQKLVRASRITLGIIVGIMILGLSGQVIVPLAKGLGAMALMAIGVEGTPSNEGNLDAFAELAGLLIGAVLGMKIGNAIARPKNSTTLN